MILGGHLTANITRGTWNPILRVGCNFLPMRTILRAALLALIAGCASESATLVNDKGERRHCYKSGGGGLTNTDRTRDFDRCVNAAGLDGFKRVNE